MEKINELGIPQYYEMYNDFLEVLKDKKTHSLAEVREYIKRKNNLSDYEVKERLPNGSTSIFNDRTGWCRTYLKYAGLLEYVDRGVYRITSEGLQLINSGAKIVTDTLLQYDSFKDYLAGSNKSREILQLKGTPAENIAILQGQLDDNLKEELLQIIFEKDSDFFEKLVVDLLVKMGYCSKGGHGVVTPSIGDEGIDGIIYQDRLGLDVIYVQAKRWKPENKVGRPEIQKFAGAMKAKQSEKGIFITSGVFSEAAIEFAKDQTISLVDGKALAGLMIEYNLGVTTKAVYNIKGIDKDYFDE